MTRLAGLFALVIAAASAPVAGAKDAAPPAPLFLSAAELDMGLELAPPPADGSPTQRRELVQLHRLERARTGQGWTKARWDDSHEDGAVFAEAIGPQFDLGELPATARLLADVRHEEKIVAKRAKVHFARRRPWVVDPSLTTCSREDGPLTSYPSGHTVMGYAMAVALAAADPPKSGAIMARAWTYGQNRLVCAMHFASDVAAGRALGTRIGQALLAKPAFQGEVQAAAAELRRLR